MVENEIFKGISEFDINRMITCLKADELQYNLRDEVGTYGENANFIGIILDGTANIVRIDINGNETILEVLEKGDVFGENIAFSQVKEDYVLVKATSALKILKISDSQITKRCEKACECHSILVENLLKLITTKTIKLYDKIQILSQRTTREKLMTYLLLQADKAHSKTFKLQETYLNIADYICAERTAMARELKKMQNDNIIKIVNKTVTIL